MSEPDDVRTDDPVWVLVRVRQLEDVGKKEQKRILLHNRDFKITEVSNTLGYIISGVGIQAPPAGIFDDNPKPKNKDQQTLGSWEQ